MSGLFETISAVQAEVAEQGIAKGQRNEYDKYNYRGIDDVLNTLAPILARHGLMIIPDVQSSTVEVVPTQKGGSQRLATVVVDYKFYDRAGDTITHRAIGEAIDRGDKAVNKAMTAAYKYFLFQAFCIPVIGQDSGDADAESHEITQDAQPQVTADQIAEFSAIVHGGKELALINFLHDVGPDTATELFNTARSGEKMKLKQKVREMEAEAHAQLSQYADDIGAAVAKQDDASIEELWRELTKYERTLVGAKLDAASQVYVKDLIKRAKERAAA